jgi:hypothetical protein
MAVATKPRRGFIRELLRRFSQSCANRIVLLLGAGRAHNPYSILRHVGRRTGREHRNPVLAQRAGRWFIIPLVYGDDVNWCRNVIAAGRCVIVWRGVEYEASGPRLLDLEIVAQRLPRFQRTLLAVTGVTRYLMLRASEPR